MVLGMITGLDSSMESGSLCSGRKPEVYLIYVNSGTIPHLPLCVRYHVEDTEK